MTHSVSLQSLFALVEGEGSCQGNIYSFELEAVCRMAGYKTSSQRSHLVNVGASRITAWVMCSLFSLHWMFVIIFKGS